jgi:hypothetical protein
MEEHKVGNRLSFVVCLSLYWSLASLLLWWSYDITPLIRGGHYRVNRAMLLVAEMGLIVTALTAGAWLLVRRRRARGTAWRLVWSACWLTWVFLLAYAGVVLARLELGHDNVPLPDSAFLPFLGHVNSHFFSEAGWIVFVIYVIPVMGLVSGLLYRLQDWAGQSLTPTPGL